MNRLRVLFKEEASSTDRFVHLGTSNQLDLPALNHSLGESSFLCAVDANCAQFCHFFSHWNQVNDVSKSFSLKCSVKSRHNNNFSLICSFLAKLHHIREELPLINAHNIIVFNIFEEMSQGCNFGCLFGDSK